MNKFETSLLQALASIDESLKVLASGKPAPKKKVAKAVNGAHPAKASRKAAKAIEKSKAAAAPTA